MRNQYDEETNPDENPEEDNIVVDQMNTSRNSHVDGKSRTFVYGVSRKSIIIRILLTCDYR